MSLSTTVRTLSSSSAMTTAASTSSTTSAGTAGRECSPIRRGRRATSSAATTRRPIRPKVTSSTPRRRGRSTFDKSCYALKRAHGKIAAGLVFLCLAEEPPTDFYETAKIFEPYIAPHELAKTKVAYQQNIVEEGNWKLVMENNRECYHCDGHPELACSLFPTWGLTDETIPPHLEDVWDRNQQAQASSSTAAAATACPMRSSKSSTPASAASASPANRSTGGGVLLGRRTPPVEEAARGSAGLPPGALLDAPAAELVVPPPRPITSSPSPAFPIVPAKTLVRTTWLVADDAVEGVDYDLETLTHTWKQTNLQDKAFVELCQQGAASPFYEQGPYMKSEYQVEAFINWYVQRMREHVG